MTQAVAMAGPYYHSGQKVGWIMRQVMVALVPATLFGFWQFGWPALFLWATTVLASVAAEALCLWLGQRPLWPELGDGSALLTGWLLALTLPPWAPWWIGVAGSLIAIVVAKQIYGGIGQNVFNPAMVARVALLVSFPVEMTHFVHPLPIFADNSPDFVTSLAITFGQLKPMLINDGITSATLLDAARAAFAQGEAMVDIMGQLPGLIDSGLGTISGSLGETSAPLLLAGGVWLIATGVMSWHIPVAMLVSLCLFAAGMHIVAAEQYPGPLFHLVSGSAIFGAFFIATDSVTSPVTARGKLLFGAGCGVLVYTIRTWTNYPEGVAFAVLLMNALTPLIDRWLRPRIHGRDRSGEPLRYPKKDGKPA